MRSKQKTRLLRDLAIVTASVVLAVIMAKTGAVEKIFAATEGYRLLGSVLAGMFVVSVFTAAPAAVVLVKLLTLNSVWVISFFAALGGVVGDTIIFRFVKDSVALDIKYLARKSKRNRLMAVFRYKIFSWLTPLLGAIIVASPLPDELGLTLLGLTNMPTRFFILISFALNFLGVLALGLAVRSIL